jgi:hypothetical protein
MTGGAEFPRHVSSRDPGASGDQYPHPGTPSVRQVGEPPYRNEDTNREQQHVGGDVAGFVQLDVRHGGPAA